MANSVFELLDKLLLTAWLLKFAQVKSDELSPVHSTEVRKRSCWQTSGLTIFLGHRDLFIRGKCLSRHGL